MNRSKTLFAVLIAICLCTGLSAASAFAVESTQNSGSAPLSAAQTLHAQAEQKTTGLYKDGGTLKYFENGKFSKKTGLVQRPSDGQWYYIKNGVHRKATGLVKCIQGSLKGQRLFVKNGKKASFTGLVKSIQGSAKGKLFYVKNGKQANFTGLVKKSPKSKRYCYVENGRFKARTGAVLHNGKYYYVKKGIRNNSYTGHVKIYGSSYKVRNGRCYYDKYRNLAAPYRYLSYSAPCYVSKSGGAVLRYGPGARYGATKRVANGTTLYERGYNSNYSWIYVRDANNNYGWIPRSQVHFIGGIAKPAIYLYPETETAVSVSVSLSQGTLMNSVPDYGSGWKVTARPDGTIVNNADGKEYPYLFWDADSQLEYDWSEGYVVEGPKTKGLLNRILPEMGLNPNETRDFIEFWLPLMKGNAYNLITFQTDRYTDAAQLEIDPAPDSLLRVFMAYKPLDKPVSIKAPTVQKFERKGFTVVEWGGSAVLGG